jgi:hypothetical protein
MRRGEFSRHLEAERDRAARNGRQWWPYQRRVDLAMSGADERDRSPYTGMVAVYRGTWSSGKCRLQNIPRRRDPYAPCGP